MIGLPRVIERGEMSYIAKGDALVVARELTTERIAEIITDRPGVWIDGPEICESPDQALQSRGTCVGWYGLFVPAEVVS